MFHFVVVTVSVIKIPPTLGRNFYTSQIFLTLQEVLVTPEQWIKLLEYVAKDVGAGSEPGVPLLPTPISLQILLPVFLHSFALGTKIYTLPMRVLQASRHLPSGNLRQIFGLSPASVAVRQRRGKTHYSLVRCWHGIRPARSLANQLGSASLF